MRTVAEFTIALLACIIPLCADAKKIRQSLKVETKSQKENREERYRKKMETKVSVKNGFVFLSPEGEKMTFPKDSVIISGYDKPASALKEAFLITNNTRFSIKEITVEITYTDMTGRMLHKRTAGLRCLIPPYETRKLEISTWDSQLSYYYFRSAESRRPAIPYKVAISPVSFTMGDIRDSHPIDKDAE